MDRSEKQKELMKFLLRALREPEDFILGLKAGGIYETTKDNKEFRQRMIRKKMFVPIKGENGKPKRGFYEVNPVLLDILRMYDEEE